jgi:hypothetical protein
MIRKNIKKSSKTPFLLYAVIWGLFILVSMGKDAYSLPVSTPAIVVEKPQADVAETIRSLDDPFDVQVRAPEIVKLFLDGLAEVKRQLEIKNKPPEEVLVPVVPSVVAPAVVPMQSEPIKPKKLEIPELKVSGIIYDTDRPQAIINGKVVSVGDVVKGVSIVKIQKGRIDARFEGADITLKFNNE